MLIIGSLYQYTQQMKMRLKAERKIYGLPTEDDHQLNTAARKAAESEMISQKISAITNKLRMGQPLSGKEMDFLRAHSPELYRKALMIAEERKAYREELQRCKTKDDVRRVHQEKMQQFSMEAKGPGAQADPEFFSWRVAAIRDEHATFLAKGKMLRLKSRAQVSQEKLQREAEIKAAQQLAAEAERRQAQTARDEENRSKTAALFDETNEAGEAGAGGSDFPTQPAMGPAAGTLPSQAMAEPALRQRTINSYTTVTRQTTLPNANLDSRPVIKESITPSNQAGGRKKK